MKLCGRFLFGSNFKCGECLVNLVCPKLQSGIRKLAKCGALYVQDNLFLTFVIFDFYFVLGGFILVYEIPIPKFLEGKYGYKF